MTSKPIDARALLRRAHLAPKRSFGQNFLVSDDALRAIATAAVPDDEVGRARVVELGAGLGALTSHLVSRARHVTAVERDRDLVPLLAHELSDAIAAESLVVLEADAQSVDLSALLAGDDPAAPRVLCGNLPYQITGRLLGLAVREASSLDRVVFLVQDEVADRLAAPPGSKTYGALTVFVRAAYSVKKVRTVSRGCFFPPPEVTSAVVVLTPEHPVRAKETDAFRDVVKRAFGARRKTLRNAWSGLAPDGRIEEMARACGISLDARGETLDVDAFRKMGEALESERR